MYLDKVSTSNLHIREKMSNAMTIIGVIQKLNETLPRYSLITIYKLFVIPHLDYGDVIYEQLNNKTYTQRIERIQYNAALAVTGAIKGTSQIKLYTELAFESLKFRRFFSKLCTFFKLKTSTKNDVILLYVLKEKREF